MDAKLGNEFNSRLFGNYISHNALLRSEVTWVADAGVSRVCLTAANSGFKVSW